MTFGMNKKMFSLGSSFAGTTPVGPLPFIVLSSFGAGEGVDGTVSAAACRLVLTPDISYFEIVYKASTDELGVLCCY